MPDAQKCLCEGLIILPLTWERASFFFFQLTNLFPNNPPGLVLGPPPIQSLFWTFQGFCSYPLRLFSQIKLHPFVSPIDSYWACPEFCFFIWFLLCMHSSPPVPCWLPLGLCLAMVFPLLFSSPPVILANGQ